MQVSEYDLIEIEKRASVLAQSLDRLGMHSVARIVTRDTRTLVERVRSLQKQLDAAKLGGPNAQV